MLQDSATVESNFQRFIKRIIEKQSVFYLGNEDGVANSVSNEDEETVILMFWSDKAYAARAKKCFDEDFNEVEMDLFDFLYRWLPGMSGDGVLAGPNWDGNLIGKEIDPFELRELIEENMSSELIAKHKQKYNELTKNT
jgi:hypothetical protein